jgi:hypothetical protein
MIYPSLTLKEARTDLGFPETQEEKPRSRNRIARQFTFWLCLSP